jgi:hypothetical protein
VAALAHIAGTLPLDLSFGDSSRHAVFPEGPLALTIEGDSIPLAPIADFVEGIHGAGWPGVRQDGHARHVEKPLVGGACRRTSAVSTRVNRV